jgi:hypothetical protein
MQPLDFSDPEHVFFWAGQNGDIVFWKIPVRLYERWQEQINDAFQAECFGEEWGSLSSFGVRTLDLATLKEIDEHCEDYDQDGTELSDVSIASVLAGVHSQTPPASGDS